MSNLFVVSKFLNSSPVTESFDLNFYGNYVVSVNFGSGLKQNSGRSDNGGKPHAHINLGNQYISCIRLDEPEYFLHGPYRKELDSKTKRRLIKFLKSEYNGDEHDGLPDEPITNWEYLAYKWNSSEPVKYVDIDKGIPDYSKL